MNEGIREITSTDLDLQTTDVNASDGEQKQHHSGMDGTEHSKTSAIPVCLWENVQTEKSKGKSYSKKKHLCNKLLDFCQILNPYLKLYMN